MQAYVCLRRYAYACEDARVAYRCTLVFVDVLVFLSAYIHNQALSLTHTQYTVNLIFTWVCLDVFSSSQAREEERKRERQRERETERETECMYAQA